MKRRTVVQGLAVGLAAAALGQGSRFAPLGITPAAAAVGPDGAILDDGRLIGEVRFYTARHSDTLHEIARAHGLGYVEIVAANPRVDPWLPGEGRTVVLPMAHILPDVERRGIVANLGDQRLYHFSASGSLQFTAPMGFGREGRDTPIGQTQITRKRANPTWVPTANMRALDPTLPASVPPGPDNPLGAFALNLGWPAYVIHGTHKPYGVGRRVSSGCIRLYPEHIEVLFNSVDVGERVTTLSAPVKATWAGGELFLQAHVHGDDVDLIEEGLEPRPADLGDGIAQIRAVAGEHAGRVDWDLATAALRARTGIPVRISRPQLAMR